MSTAYEALSNRLYRDISHRLEKGHDGHFFATVETAEAVFNYETLQVLYQSLTTPTFDADIRFGIGKKIFVERVRSRKLHTFLAILTFARPGNIHAARTFTSRLVAPDPWPIPGNGLNLLPADRKWLQHFFGDDDFVTAQEFFTKQASFCTVVLRKRQEVIIHDPEAQRLPYLEEKQLAQGSFGTVFKVKIAKGHFLDPSTDPEMANIGPMDLARKDYRISDDFRAKDERDVMETILGISRSSENILENFGSIQIGDTYSLFMPLAICDLKQYMMSPDFHPMRPSTTEAKANLIRCAEGLADGLKFLHSEMGGIVCFHMDLKPGNILIFRNRTRGGENREIWKLSDFGMARVKIRRPHGHVNGGERNFDRLFIRRQKLSDPSLSLTLNRRGEGTYLAPESFSANPSMGTWSDVWSLGCVISVLLAYFEGGRKSIEEYIEARAKDAQGYDRFFLPGHFGNPKVHSAVRTMHKRCITQAKQHSLAEGEAVAFILGYLESNVLVVNPTKRDEAHDVKAKLAETFDLFIRLGEPETELEGEPFPRRPGHGQERPAQVPQPGKQTKRFMGFLSNDLTKSSHRRASNAKRPVSREDVQRWQLAQTEDFKGSDISPDGTLIVLWTEIKIVLYNSTSFSVREGEKLTVGSEYTLETTHGFWKTMSVTRKYLIACETGSNFNCYIFNLDNDKAVDANLEQCYRLTLPLPQIHKIAISDNSQRVAFILQSTEGHKSPGTLFYTQISDLIDEARKPTEFLKPSSTTSSDGTSHNSLTSFSTASSPWQMVSMEWPGPDFTHLAFPNENTIHAIVHPEITGSSREHRIPITLVSLDTKTRHPFNIVPKGLDPSSTVELFTTFAPFHNELACVVITREKRIHLLRGHSPYTPGKEIHNYRVLELMVNSRDDVMYALGTSSANHNVLLLELPLPDKGDDYEVKELAQLDGLKSNDDFKVNLSEDGGERHVLVAALVSGSRRMVYRVRLP